MNAARTEHPIDPPPEDDTADNVRRQAVEIITGQAEVISGLQRTIDELQRGMARDNWRKLVASQAAAKDAPEVWRALKAAAGLVGIDYQRVRGWCKQAVIVAERRGKRWFVRMDSLQAHVAALRGK
jgi:hypothetical protein